MLFSQTCAAFDDARGILFTGANDGSVFVRKVEISESTGAVSMKLIRYCNPTEGAGAVLTCMWYDTALDRLYTGDITGCARVVKAVSFAFRGDYFFRFRFLLQSMCEKAWRSRERGRQAT